MRPLLNGSGRDSSGSGSGVVVVVVDVKFLVNTVPLLLVRAHVRVCLTGFGMLIGVVAMVLMGAVEVARKYELSEHGSIEQDIGGVRYNASRLSLFWQTPQFLLVGVAESFTLVSGEPISLPEHAGESQSSPVYDCSRDLSH